jgi:antitoxin component YwqK of YwqJK toxin-antitoxin module
VKWFAVILLVAALLGGCVSGGPVGPLDWHGDGIVTNYHPNGMKAIEGPYRNGVRHGLWISYDENGTVETIQIFKDGAVAE